MGESQCGFQYRYQGATGCALYCGRAAIAQLYFGKFHIPVAVFIPDKLIDFPGCNIKAIILKSLPYCAFRMLQTADDPFVCIRKLQGCSIVCLVQLWRADILPSQLIST